MMKNHDESGFWVDFDSMQFLIGLFVLIENCDHKEELDIWSTLIMMIFSG